MDYHANIDAVLYFAREIWPELHRARPELRFVIVGSRPAPSVVALAREPGISVTGMVETVQPYYENALEVVVPLRVGSGTRLKVLEAMAAGVPVVSTRLGAEGLDVTGGEHLALADTPPEFASTVLRLANNESEWRRIAAAGREVVRSKYDWPMIGESLYEYYAHGAGIAAEACPQGPDAAIG
jgi:glycosyltransferase involved in cell wall biosynthesis